MKKKEKAKKVTWVDMSEEFIKIMVSLDERVQILEMNNKIIERRHIRTRDYLEKAELFIVDLAMPLAMFVLGIVALISVIKTIL